MFSCDQIGVTGSGMKHHRGEVSFVSHRAKGTYNEQVPQILGLPPAVGNCAPRPFQEVTTCPWEDVGVQVRHFLGVSHCTPSRREHPAVPRVVVFEDLPFLYNMAPRREPTISSAAHPETPQLFQHRRKAWLCRADWEVRCQFPARPHLPWRFSRVIFDSGAVLTDFTCDPSLPQREAVILSDHPVLCILTKTFLKPEFNILCTLFCPDREGIVLVPPHSSWVLWTAYVWWTGFF